MVGYLDKHHVAMITTLASLRRAAIICGVLPTAWLFLFYFLPLGTILIRAFDASILIDVLGNSGVRSVLWFTLWQATLSTALTLIVAFPITWACSQWNFTGKRFIVALVTVPFVLPTVIVAGAIRAVLPESLNSGVVGILFAHVIFNVAIVLRIVGARWQQEHPNTVAASRTLGATAWNTFSLITWPMIRSAVGNAVGIIFVFCFTSFGIIRILGGPRYSTIEVEIFIRAVQLGDTSVATALVVLQLVVVGLVLGLTMPRSLTPLKIVTYRPSWISDYPRQQKLVRSSVFATVLFVGTPFLVMFINSFRVDNNWSLSPWRHLFDGTLSPMGVNISKALGNSVLFASITVLITVPLALCLASISAYSTTHTARRLIAIVASAPLATSAVALGLGMIITFDQSPIDWRSHWFLLVCAHCTIALPLALRSLTAPLQSIPLSMRDSARILGASPLQTWWYVDIAIIRRPLLVAAGLSAAVSLGEFGATSFLTRTGNETIPTTIARLLGRPGDVVQSSGYALASLFVLLVIGAMINA